MMPLYFGEVPIIFWQPIKGARVSEPLSMPGGLGFRLPFSVSTWRARRAGA
jgi:hypothetical protein